MSVHTHLPYGVSVGTFVRVVEGVADDVEDADLLVRRDSVIELVTEMLWVSDVVNDGVSEPVTEAVWELVVLELTLAVGASDLVANDAEAERDWPEGDGENDATEADWDAEGERELEASAESVREGDMVRHALLEPVRRTLAVDLVEAEGELEG